MINHPFVDGNKRTGLLGLLLMLHSENFDLNVSDEETYQFTIDISIGKLKFDEIVIWLKANTAKKQLYKSFANLIYVLRTKFVPSNKINTQAFF